TLKKRIVVVVPFAGTWIETFLPPVPPLPVASFPSRERGLKPARIKDCPSNISVVPFAGTWIETDSFFYFSADPSSFPSRERGLKPLSVAVGIPPPRCRSLRGNVD